MQSIVDRIYGIRLYLGFLNMFIIEGNSGLVLVDTGISGDSIDFVEQELGAVHRRLDEIRHILITHAHYDHTGGLAEIQRRINARTYAHRREALVIRGEKPVQPPPVEDLRGFSRLMAGTGKATAGDPARVDVQLQEGDTLDELLPGLQVVELPGHSPGQVGYYWPKRRLLIGGDVMIRYPWGLRMPLRPYTTNWEIAQESVRRVAEMDVEILCLGHGRPIAGGAGAHIRALANRQ